MIITVLVIVLVIVVRQLIIRRPPLAPSPPYGQSQYSDSGFQRVRLKQNLNLKGWNSHVHRAFPGKLESNNLSIEIPSREIRRISSITH